MKKAVLYTGVILSLLISSAHYLRAGNKIAAFIFLFLNILILFKEKICKLILSIALIAGFITYLYTTVGILSFRIENGFPFIRAGIILLTVTALIGTVAFLYIKEEVTG